MDINDLRAAFTVIMFVMFIGIVVWAWSNKRRSAFSEAANLPLNEPENPRSDNEVVKKESNQ
ncbi:MAG: cbb3-type cytochrome c oxidase subunit 3 [Gammaproteobacteria bacterium]|nr:cbb3-type cytochrome c oxidase subunit 3 [Gammaproteobacteria bacterium]MDH5777903.1 cbb3-type cytochrome c oxidase subunit 3 [Gammaproteobacteria bacterium]